MYFQKLGQKYSFLYYDSVNKRNVRLRLSETPNITSDEEAEAFCKRWDRKIDATKNRIKRRLEWQNRHHDFVKLLEIYEVAHKEEAPNAWESDQFYLEYYVFPFFLEKKNCNNLNLWCDYFEEFRDFLLTVKPLKTKRGQQTIAYSTKNNIIKTLNTFLLIMHRRKYVELIEKCRYFPKSKVNRKNEESVILPELQTTLFQTLKPINSEAAVFFWISLNTGLRMNELFGLSLADFFAGASSNRPLEDALKPYGLKSYGHLVIESQPKDHHKARGDNGKVLRKPLKQKKRMGHAESRVIPIFDKQTFNFLVGLFNAQQFNFMQRCYGDDPKDYLFFESLNKNIYSNALRSAQKRLRFARFYTPHDTRHTYSTWLAEQTGGNYTLCRLILGHESIDITLRYTHLSAQIAKDIRIKSQLLTPLQILS